MEMLECLGKGELDHCFIEANVCEGGCAKGPASAHWNTSYVKTKVKIENGVSYKAARDLPDMTEEELHKEFGDHSLSDEMPSEEQIRHILKSTGKYSAEDELNCGACGYSTCREKAVGRLSGESRTVDVHALCTDAGRIDVQCCDGCDAEYDLCHWKRYEDIRLQQERAGSSRSRTGGSGTTVYF